MVAGSSVAAWSVLGCNALPMQADSARSTRVTSPNTRKTDARLNEIITAPWPSAAGLLSVEGAASGHGGFARNVIRNDA
jgi:hypothetical protein